MIQFSRWLIRGVRPPDYLPWYISKMKLTTLKIPMSILTRIIQLLIEHLTFYWELRCLDCSKIKCQCYSFNLNSLQFFNRAGEDLFILMLNNFCKTMTIKPNGLFAIIKTQRDMISTGLRVQEGTILPFEKELSIWQALQLFSWMVPYP